MSRKHFSNNTGHVIGELDVDESRISGSGGAEYPYLYWQMELAMQLPKTPLSDYALRSVTAHLSFTAGQKIADARPLLLHRVIHGYHKHAGNEYLYLEFPLDARRIEAIEQRRQGGSLQLRLEVKIQFDEFSVLPAHEESKRPQLWGLKDAHFVTLQETIQVSQSHWTNRVLPHIGYGNVHVLEFPSASLEACATLEHSFKALKQADEKHRLGFYDDAAGKCRLAIEPFFEQQLADPSHPESRKVPVLKKHWETKLGRATYEWLKVTLGSIKDATNPPHHSPNEHYSQLDSQMILAVTTAVVAYIARIIRPEDLKEQ